jgi:hypothetical protein
MPKRIRDLRVLTPATGDYLAADKPAGDTYKLPIGQANGVPFLNASGALASTDAYLNRGYYSAPVDWNTLTTAGVYGIYSGAFGEGSANTPPATYKYGTLLVLASGPSSAIITQIYIPHHTDFAIYFRQFFSAWGPWFATGAISGSNSNGSYTRFADGTQICWAISVGAGPDPKTVTYPAAFLYPPAVIVTLADWPAAHISVDSMWGYGTTQQRFRKYYTDGSVYNGPAFFFNYIAIGRWK